jgi:hypothetical protein
LAWLKVKRHVLSTNAVFETTTNKVPTAVFETTTKFEQRLHIRNVPWQHRYCQIKGASMRLQHLATPARMDRSCWLCAWIDLCISNFRGGPLPEAGSRIWPMMWARWASSCLRRASSGQGEAK